MTRVRSLYFCMECGAESVRWEGRCPSCSAWNSLSEAPAGGHGEKSATAATAVAGPLGRSSARTSRLAAGLGGVDRVLGGGFVPGSVSLLGGAPGIGKSTLLLQIAAEGSSNGMSVLYASGEESREQVRLRAGRVAARAEDLLFLGAEHIEDVIAAARRARPDMLFVDSIQTMSVEGAGAPGGVGQVRTCAARLQEYAKHEGVATVLVGHITKGGALAGPRSLEHMVDVVLHFEGRQASEVRLLRSSKNRFGATDEIAVYRMTRSGLDPVDDPSGLFLSDRPVGLAGAAVGVAVHGSQALLTEIQALTASARFASPQRMTTGYPGRRLAVLLAVLERRAGLPLGVADVFLNVVGGGRVTDTATDLAVVAALASAHADVPIGQGTVLIGEVGLGGEVRGVSAVEARARVARQAGFDTVVLPGAHREALATVPGVRFVDHVRELGDAAGWA